MLQSAPHSSDSPTPELSRIRHGALWRRKARRYRSRFFVLVAVLALGALFFGRQGDDVVIVQASAQEGIVAAESVPDNSVGGVPAPSLEEEREIEKEGVVRYEVLDGDIPAEIFSAYAGYDANDVAALLIAAEDVYDFTAVRVGKEIFFAFDEGDSRAREVRYEPDGSRAIVAMRSGDDFSVVQEDIIYDTSSEVASVRIENSLYQDALEDGMSEATIIGVGEVFSYSLDFASEIQKGDTLRVLYEKRLRDGKRAKDGKVLAAVFEASGVKHYAYYFETDSDDFGYYDEGARVLERQFLKAPMEFFRITSGYTGRRLHPVTNKFSAHYQIDYAAPTGTPAFSTARGTVVSARFETGWGNIVRIKHSGGYTTHYAHLSGFAKGMVPGAKVQQGDIIGFVGSTGWSTGPHLDYGMRLNGNPVNPLKLELPKGAPISDDQRSDFDVKRAEYDRLLGF
jgi:murein DD-endopeptidase MepM/ murein hydrolase activator NlpD